MPRKWEPFFPAAHLFSQVGEEKGVGPHLVPNNSSKIKNLLTLRRENSPEYSKNNEKKMKITVIFQGGNLAETS